MERRKSVTPPFSQLPRSMTAGIFLPSEGRRSNNPFPQFISRCFGFRRPYLARPTLAQPSEMHRTSFFNNSWASGHDLVILCELDIVASGQESYSFYLSLPEALPQSSSHSESLTEKLMRADSLTSGISFDTSLRASKAFLALSIISRAHLAKFPRFRTSVETISTFQIFANSL